MNMTRNIRWLLLWTMSAAFLCFPLPSQASEKTPESAVGAAEASADDSDGSEPESEPQPVITEQLRIDGRTLYEGMANTYEQGYIPLTDNGAVHIVLPLIGRTYDGKVTVTADLGSLENSPFVYGNYSQTVGQTADGIYLFRFDIPLVSGRINGSYPVTLRADYLDAAGSQARQDFTVYVTVTDGAAPVSPDAKPTVETPKLYVSSCEITPSAVGAEEEFTVHAAVENIGAIRARSVLLSYGSETGDLIPAQTGGVQHLENIAAGKSAEASFSLRATAEALAGNQPFFVRLDYVDLYGGTYTETFSFFVRVTQPAEMEYDPLAVPEQVAAGESFPIPASVRNTGKSVLHNVTVYLDAPGLLLTSSAFLGNIQPGESKNGEMKVYAETLPEDAEDSGYCSIEGTAVISCQDDFGETLTTEVPFSTRVVSPADQSKAEREQQKTASQWWISVLVTFAAIAILISGMVISRFSRMMQMR